MALDNASANEFARLLAKALSKALPKATNHLELLNIKLLRSSKLLLNMKFKKMTKRNSKKMLLI
jgi:hypothetical protein